MFRHKNHSGKDYKFGCLKIDLSIPDDEWEKIIDSVEDSDVYKPEEDRYGKETNPHVTVLFGIHEGVEDYEIVDICNRIDPSLIFLKIKEIDSFSNSEFDVIKLNIESDALNDMNSMFKSLPHTNSFPDYRPHITISYLNRGTSKKYDRVLESPMVISGITNIIYSKPNGDKMEIVLGNSNV